MLSLGPACAQREGFSPIGSTCCWVFTPANRNGTVSLDDRTEVRSTRRAGGGALMIELKSATKPKFPFEAVMGRDERVRILDSGLFPRRMIRALRPCRMPAS